MRFKYLRLIYCICGGLLLWLTGCRPAYVPNRQHVPLLKQKGDLSISVNPRNLQLAYSPVPHLGLMANGFYRAAKGHMPDYTDDPYEEERFKTFLSLAEGAIGFYYPISPDSAFRFELYSGFGAGEVNVNIQEEDIDQNTGVHTYTYRKFQAQQQRAFAQPAVGYSTDDLAIVLSTRISSVRFTNRRFRNLDSGWAYHYGLHTVERNHVLVEPALTIRGGSRNVKAEIQFTFIDLTGPEQPMGNATFVHTRPAINFSLHVGLGQRQRPRTKPPVLQ